MALTQVKSDGIATGAVTATQIAANAVTVDDIADGSISTAKLADDAVTADKLANTAVTAGSYGSGSAIPAITVDAQGRITAASTNAISVESDRIFEGNTSAEAVDTGSDGHFKVVTEGTEALRVDSSQRVGIGLTAPDTALHLGNSSTLRINNPDGTRNLDLFNDANNAEIKASVDPLRLNAEHSSGYIRLDTNNTERARLTSAGNLGIGTTSPQNSFVVSNGGAAGLEVFFADSGGSPAILSYNRSTSARAPLYLTAEDVRFQAGGSERARITSTGNLQFNSGYGSVATAYGVRAWVNFNGTGTVSIRNSGNCSGITDRGTGQYTIGYTTAMPDANYAVTATAMDFATSNNSYTYNPIFFDFGTTGVKVDTFNNSTYDDYQQVCVAIIR